MHKWLWTKRMLVLGIFSLLVAAPWAISAQNGLVETVVIDVWIRSGAGTEWRKIDLLPAGTTVALDGRESSGAWVRGIASNGAVGWMAARFLTVTPEAVFSLPIIDREAPLTVSAPAQGSGPAIPAVPANAEEPESAPALVPAPSGGLGAAVTARVNMRSGPGTQWRRVGGLEVGERINLDGRDATIGWVRGINSRGVIGWIAAQYTGLPFDQIAALPIVTRETPFGASAPAGGPAPAAVPSVVNIAPVASNAPVTGFSYGGHVQGLSDNTVRWMRVAGMTWVKKQVRYNQGDDPNNVGGIIADAHAKGFRILLGIVGNPQQLNNPGYFEQYAAFVGSVAALGADAIEVWNEPNIDREWVTGQVDPARYTQLLAQAYNAIKSNNPNTLVISGAPAPTGFFGGCSANGCDDAPYISGMAAAGAANYMDCIGAHYNEGIVGPNVTSGDPRSEYYTRYFWGMVNTYYAAFGGRRPICFTELGYLSPEGYPPLPPAFGWALNVTVAQQAQWLDQAVALSRSSGKVRLVIIWNVDFDFYGDDPMAGYAMIRPGNVCLACEALGR